jgi:hypothetical protein
MERQRLNLKPRAQLVISLTLKKLYKSLKLSVSHLNRLISVTIKLDASNIILTHLSISKKQIKAKIKNLKLPFLIFMRRNQKMTKQPLKLWMKFLRHRKEMEIMTRKPL